MFCPYTSFRNQNLGRLDCWKDKCALYDDERKECSQKSKSDENMKDMLEKLYYIFEQLRIMNMNLERIADNIWAK